ncbi:zinc ribbon domain-containing protein [Haladaptatus pallidirubidus]|uniref:DUF7130 domain-containing protein n=1 Tax=Haladaptatus pallidirubidus TaxID=1008152 RepID=A0AAV3UPI0_9EURY|nr:zinc ribbon domain-containing protein [Haladaptatus pallidirubidus]
MSDDHEESNTRTPIETGVVVYDHEGNELGVITGLTGEGFEVSINENIEHVDKDGQATVTDRQKDKIGRTTDTSIHSSNQEQNPGQKFGEGYLMWRCDNCGEMGNLGDGLPTTCPDCGSENVYKWRED